jgi:hypothetical protein
VKQGENTLRVPKVTLPVTLALSRQAPRAAEIFVTGHGLRSRPRELVLDLLNQDERFLPAHVVEQDEWILFNKASMLWVGLERSGSSSPFEEDAELELFDRRFTVLATFDDGSCLEGEMLFSPPATGGRVLDHLNKPETFFALYRANSVYLVNKTTLVTISERHRAAETRQSGGED